MVANDCHLLQIIANGKQWLTVVAIGRKNNHCLPINRSELSLQFVPMVTNGTNGKIYNGTIGKTPNATIVSLFSF